MTEGIWIFIISQAIVLIGTAIAMYIRTTTKIKEIDIRLYMQERQDSLILEKLDTISEQITELRIDMQNKKDKE